jgi:alpha/beta superfamily hydrolase
MPPKREERMVTIALDASGGVLEGLYIAGDDAECGGVVIAPPHPLYGGSMDSPVVSELAYAARAAGLASLRFNWRGVGASAGTPSGDVAAAVADYTAALDQLEASVAGPIVAGGYSFGAAAALLAGVRRVRVGRLLLVAPPPAALDASALASFPGDALVVAAQHDEIAPPRALADLTAGLERARLEIVPEADHFFGAGLGVISRFAGEFLGAPAAGAR